MWHGRFITLSATLALAVGLTVAPGAFANAPGTDTSVPISSAPTTETSVPVTSKPTPEKPVTEVPVTETPVTEVPVTEVPTCANTPTLEGCTPDEPEVTTPEVTIPDDAPGVEPGGGDTLPFTGPGDVVLAIVIALLAGTGGILFLFGASSREAIEGLSKRTMSSPSGFKLAYRELLKQQMKD